MLTTAGHRCLHARSPAHDPDGVWAAPGRINLIGEHTDYNDGFVLPFALPQAAYVAAGAARPTVAGGSAPSTSTRPSNSGRTTWCRAAPAGSPTSPAWSGPCSRPATPSPVPIVVLTSDVPLGAGLSSSAAIECAALAAFADLNGLDIEPLDRAKLARTAENAYVGAPTGLLDQAASTLCIADHALFLDCRDFASRQVPLAVTGAGLEILVVDTRTRHSHVDGEYAARRASCEEASRILGVPALRDVTDLEAALAQLPEMIGRRVRHIVTENARVLESVAALDAGRLRPARRADDRLARVDARRLRDHGDQRRPCRRDRLRRRRPRRPDDRWRASVAACWRSCDADQVEAVAAAVHSGVRRGIPRRAGHVPWSAFCGGSSPELTVPHVQGAAGARQGCGRRALPPTPPRAATPRALTPVKV